MLHLLIEFKKLNMKRLLKTIVFAIPFLSITTAFSQTIQFMDLPEDYRLYARNELNNATVYVNGIIKGKPVFDEVSLIVYKDGKLFDTQKQVLKDNKVSISTLIHSGLHEYSFEFYVKKQQKDSLYFVADNIVCGDAYIITGQSNSHPSSTLSTYSSPYCRSFGVKTGYETYNDSDQKIRWGLATGNCPDLKKEVGGWFTKNPHGVGVWGMELMRLIVEKYKVPVCIINGGSGSSSIEQNMLYPEKPSLETSFGRLAYRVDQAGLKDKIKAIFWHQGESNSNTKESVQAYESNFDILLKDWKKVYTSLEKIYLFQLHPGCGQSPESFSGEMREIQTQITQKYDMIDIMSTLGVPGHDGCHFSYPGYLEFAKRIFPLLSRDYYKEKLKGIISPPKFIKAQYLVKTKIALEFDQAVVLEDKKEVNGELHFLKDQFFFDFKDDKSTDLNTVKSIEVKDKSVILTLHNPYDFKDITYLPNKYYSGTTTIYNGPWLNGAKNNIGALSFYKKPILDKNALSNKDASLWNGYKMIDSTLNGVKFKIVFPKKANSNKDWIWRARFWGHEPQTDLALLDQGFHLVYIEVGGLFGNEKAMKIWDSFYEFVTNNYQLNPKVVLEGMSRGGLIIFNWGNRNAEKVACIYADAPVCDFKSWPAGKGKGEGSAGAWESCLKIYGFSEEVALQYNGNPINHMESIASYKVPILCVVGDMDTVVPVSENTTLLQKRLNSLGWDLTLIHKPEVGHHPHSLKDPKPIVDFILMNTQKK